MHACVGVCVCVCVRMCVCICVYCTVFVADINVLFNFCTTLQLKHSKQIFLCVYPPSLPKHDIHILTEAAKFNVFAYHFTTYFYLVLPNYSSWMVSFLIVIFSHYKHLHRVIVTPAKLTTTMRLHHRIKNGEMIDIELYKYSCTYCMVVRFNY